MVAGGEDDLICDFAQVYHVLDWRGLPLPLAAVLASGLPADARVRRRQTGQRAPDDTVLLATLVDQMAQWLWHHSPKGTPRPESIAMTFIDKPQKKHPLRVFRSGADFEAALAGFLR